MQSWSSHPNSQPPGSVIVRLTNKSLTREAAGVIATSLSAKLSPHSIDTVDISDIIAGRPEEEALAVLATLCSALAPACTDVHEVNVSDNALGTTIYNYVFLFKLPHIIRFRIQGCVGV